jgi:hypothetical protein
MHLPDKWGDLYQLSYITRDMDAAIAHCRRELGVETFHVGENPAEVIAGGTRQTLVVKAAIANFGRHQFELIQPVSGPIHHYDNVLGEGSGLINFHHIAIAVRGGFENWQALVAELDASGDEIAFISAPETLDPPMVAFCYVDTRHRLGHYTEYLWWHESLASLPSFPNLDA